MTTDSQHGQQAPRREDAIASLSDRGWRDLLTVGEAAAYLGLVQEALRGGGLQGLLGAVGDAGDVPRSTGKLGTGRYRHSNSARRDAQSASPRRPLTP
jgi:hypothetical protein